MVWSSVTWWWMPLNDSAWFHLWLYGLNTCWDLGIMRWNGGSIKCKVSSLFYRQVSSWKITVCLMFKLKSSQQQEEKNPNCVLDWDSSLSFPSAWGARWIFIFRWTAECILMSFTELCLSAPSLCFLLLPFHEAVWPPWQCSIMEINCSIRYILFCHQANHTGILMNKACTLIKTGDLWQTSTGAVSSYILSLNLSFSQLHWYSRKKWF